VDVTVNGTSRSVPQEATVEWLVVKLLDRHPAGIAVAVNGTVVPPTSWRQTLSEGDRVELVMALQGG